MIVEQPDGLYAVYSTITESFLLEDATKQEVKKFRREQAMERFEKTFKREWERVEKHGTSGGLSYENAVERVENIDLESEKTVTTDEMRDQLDL